MATNKKSFLLYCDLIHTVEKLSDQDAGELFKHLLRYVNDQEPQTENPLVDLSFEPIKQQLKRDLKDWEEQKNKRSEAGRKGGLASASKRKQSLTTVDECQANQAVNVNVNVNDNVNVIECITAHTTWKDQILRVLKITPEELERLAGLFSLVSKPQNDEAEQRRHFANWVKTQDYITTEKPKFDPYG